VSTFEAVQTIFDVVVVFWLLFHPHGIYWRRRR